MGRARCARRERQSRLSLFGLRRPAGPASSSSFPGFLSRLPRAALLLAGAVAVAPPTFAQSTTLVSNTGQTTADNSSTRDRSQTFRTGANDGGYTLTSVEVAYNDAQGESFTVSVCSVDASNHPTSSCTSLTAPETFSAGTLTFTAPSGTTLAKETTYSLLMTFSATVTLKSVSTDDEDAGKATGWSIGNTYQWRRPGEAWQDDGNGRSLAIAIIGTAKSSSTNTAPTASNGEVETDEDEDYTFDHSDFNFADTDSGDTELASVKIVTLPGSGKGTLELDGTTIGSTDLPKTVTKAELDDDKLIYEPPDDANGNDYTTFTFRVNDGDDDSADTYTMTIDVDSVPDVTDVEVTSTPRSGSGTEKKYGEGETVEVTVTFDEAVTVTSDPHVRLRISVTNGDSEADYTSGSETTELVFQYTVLAGDSDNTGLSVRSLQLDSNDRIRDADGHDADVSFTALQNLEDHKVDGSLSDSTAPSAVSASVWSRTVTITFDEPLDSGSVPGRGAFSVKRTRSGTEGTATLTGTPSIDGDTVTLQIAAASAVLATDTLFKVTYTKPGSGDVLEDAEDNEVATFTLSGDKVTYVSDTTAPSVESAEVDGTSLVITFDEDLAAAPNLPNAAFTVIRWAHDNDGSQTEDLELTGSPAIAGKTLTLTLQSAPPPSDNVHVDYNKEKAGTGNELKDAANNKVADFGETVTNNTPVGLVFAGAPVTVDEEGTQTYTVKLAARPRGTVSVAIASDDAPAATAAPTPLTFTTANWEDAQTVTVTGVDDADEDDETVTLTHSGTDVTPGEVAVTVRDNDSNPVADSATVDGAELQIVFSRDLAAAASLANDAFTVKVTPSGGTEAEVALTGSPAISGKTVTLTLASAVRRPDTVTVSYAKPGTDANNRLEDSDGREVADFDDLTVTNDTDPGLVFLNDDDEEITSLEVYEEGVNLGLYRVRLDSEPPASVTVSVASGDTSAVTIRGDPVTLTFTTMNWNQGQSVLLAGAADPDKVSETVTITHSGAGVITGTITVKTLDDDADPPNAASNLRITAWNENDGPTIEWDLPVSQPPGVTVAKWILEWRVAGPTSRWGINEPLAERRAAFTSHTTTAVGSVGGRPFDVRMVLESSEGGRAFSPELAVGSIQTPDNLRLDGTAGTTSIPLAWDLPSVQADWLTVNNLLVQRDVSGTWIAVKTLAADAASTTLTGLAAGTNYRLRLAWHTNFGVIGAGLDGTGTFRTPAAELVLSRTSVTLDEDGTATYTVKLGAEPAADVVVTVESGDDGAATVAPAALTFTPSTWNDAQTVTVTGVDDANENNETVTIAHGIAGGQAATVTATVRDNDGDPMPVFENSLGEGITSLEVYEDGFNSYLVRLNKQPQATVTVRVESGDASALAITGAPVTLTFTAQNWDRGQRVYLAGVDDSDKVSETVAITHGGAGLGTGTLSVKTLDDDADPPNPAANLRVTAWDEDDGPTIEWDLPATQPVGVTVAKWILQYRSPHRSLDWTQFDPLEERRTAFTRHTERSFGTAGGGAPADVRVVLESGDGGQAASGVLSVDDFEVPWNLRIDGIASATAIPLAWDLRSPQPGWLTVNALLVQRRNGGSWTTVATLAGDATSTTLTGLKANTAYRFRVALDTNLGTIAGDEGRFRTLDVPLVFSKTDVAVNEGDTATYTVKLARRPSAEVTVNLASGNTDAVTVAPATLTFRPHHHRGRLVWDDPQEVTVTALQDPGTFHEAVTIAHGIRGAQVGAVTVRVTDDESTGPLMRGAAVNGASLTISFRADLAAADNLANGAFTVKVAPSGSGEAAAVDLAGAPAIDGDTLTLTLAEAVAPWDTVTLSYEKPGTDNDNRLEDTNGREAASFTDSAVSNRTPVNIVKVVLSKTEVTVDEDAESATHTATYTVKLDRPPPAYASSATVWIDSLDLGAATVSPDAPTFDAVTWNTPLDVTVTGVADPDVLDETVTIRNRVAYTLATLDLDTVLVSAGEAVTVTVTDDDVPAILVSRASVDLVEGGTGTWEVRLDTQPLDDVTVSLASGDTGAATVRPSSLVFTPSDWNDPREVRVTGVGDADSNGETTTVTHSATGLEDVDVAVTVNDDDAGACPSGQPAGAIWQACLTIGKDEIGFYGFIPAASSTGALSDDGFTFRAANLVITNLTYDSSLGLILEINGNLRGATDLVLQVGSTSLNLPASDSATYRWPSPGFSWGDANIGDKVSVSLRPKADTDLTAPRLRSALVRGSRVSLTFNERLATDTYTVDASAFTVKAGGTAMPLSAADPVTHDGAATVTLRLAAAVKPSDTVTVTYSRPADPTGIPRDRRHNPVLSFTDEPVVNYTTACGDHPEDAFWTACLTIGQNGPGTSFGFGGTGTGFGALSAESFTHDGATNGIDGLRTVSGGGLALSFADDPGSAADAWVLEVGGRNYALGGSNAFFERIGSVGFALSSHTWSWAGDPGWASGDVGGKVSVSLRERRGHDKPNRFVIERASNAATDQLHWCDESSEEDLTSGCDANSFFELRLTEGQSGRYKLSLGVKPDREVTVRLRPRDPGATRVSPGSLTFTPSNYNVGQVVTVEALQDTDGINEYDPVIQEGGGATPYWFYVRIADDDEHFQAGHSLVYDDGCHCLRINKGATKTFTVRPRFQPEKTMTLNWEVYDYPPHGVTLDTTGTPGIKYRGIKVSPREMTFTRANWETTQEFTVTVDSGVAFGTEMGLRPWWPRDQYNYTKSPDFRIVVENNLGGTLPGAPAVDAVPGDGEVRLGWTPPDDGDAITNWQFRHGEVNLNDGNVDWGRWTAVPGGEADARAHTVTGLANGTYYGFQVRGRVGQTAAGESVSALAMPMAELESNALKRPELDVVSGNAQAELSWDDIAYGGTITGWRYRYGELDGPTGAVDWGEWTAIAGADADTRAFTLTGLANDVEYGVQLRAVAGETLGEMSERQTAWPYHPTIEEAAVTGVTATTVGLEWTLPDGVTPTGLRVQQRARPPALDWGEWQDAADLALDATSHTVTGLSPATRYQFRIVLDSATGGTQSGLLEQETPERGPLDTKMSGTESEDRGKSRDSLSPERSVESGGEQGCAVEVTVAFLDEDGEAVAVDALAASDFTAENGRVGTPVAAADGLSWTVPVRATTNERGFLRVRLRRRSAGARTSRCSTTAAPACVRRRHAGSSRPCGSTTLTFPRTSTAPRRATRARPWMRTQRWWPRRSTPMRR